MTNSFAIGIDIGGGSIRSGLYDRLGNELKYHSVPTPLQLNNDLFLQALEESILPVLQTKDILGIGVGSPGPLDTEKGILVSSANMKGISNVPIIPFLKDKFGLPCFYENDANCAALGEAYFGEYKNLSSQLILTLGTGLGGGFVSNGKLYSGYLGNGIEIGHTTAVIGGRDCGCGQKGCVESYFSTKAFIGSYAEKTGNNLQNAKEFFELVRKGDPNAIQILEFGTECLAHAIRGAIHILNPEAIVLVGGITKSADLFFEALENKIRSLIFPILEERLKIGIGGGFVGSLGAAGLVFSK